MDNKILLVGGNWDEEGGRASSVVKKFAEELPNVTTYNGGYYSELSSVLDKCRDYPIVLWWANVDNSLPKLRAVKEVNYKTMLVSSKRNNGEYSFQDLLSRCFELKSNLMVEFSKSSDKYKMRLFDPLGNLWYEGEDISECAKKLVERLDFIKSITRESTSSDEENRGALAWFFNMFKQEMYRSDESETVPEKKEFLEVVKDYAIIFAKATFRTEEVKRFLGNASFRCPKGFPSFRNGKYVFVSKRNVNKEHITIEEFVPVYKKDDKIFYCGDAKPSVDTPIQVRLYELLPNIEYMLHSHCYIEGVPFTKEALPCGAIEEVDEIITFIREHYNNDFGKDFYLINLKGHGSIMMSSSPEKLKNIKIVGRNLPEKMW